MASKNRQLANTIQVVIPQVSNTSLLAANVHLSGNIIFNDGTTQFTSATPASTGAFIQANAAFSLANTISTNLVDSYARVVANAAFNKANTASGSGGALSSRTVVSGTTSSIANNTTSNLDVSGYKSYVLLKVQTDQAAWVRIYTDGASRANDSTRVSGADPIAGAGVIAEVITSGANTIIITPGVYGFNNEPTVNTNIAMAVTNYSGATNSVTVTLTAVQLEI
jgi:hypothetical protein